MFQITVKVDPLNAILNILCLINHKIYFNTQKHSHQDEHFGMFDNQNRHLSPNVLDLFLGTIKNVIGSQQHTKNVKHRHSKNETNKGIDIALDSNTHMIPSLGNKQDLKFIFLGMCWKLRTIHEIALSHSIFQAQNGVAVAIMQKT